MGVSDGQPVNAATTNPAFLDANADDTALGKIDLNNGADVTESGAQVTNIQRELNGNASYTGQTTNTPKTRLPSWTSANIGSASDNLTQRSESISQSFDTITGHNHNGANSAPVDALGLTNINLFKAQWGQFVTAERSQIELFDFAGLTGTDYDVVGDGLFLGLAGVTHYVWFNVTDGANTQSDPALTGTAIQVDILDADTAGSIASKVKTQVDAASVASVSSTSIVNTTSFRVVYVIGSIVSGTAGDSLVLFSIEQTGVSTNQEETWLFAGLTGTDYDVAGSGLKFNFADSLGYAWFNVTDGANSQSDPGGTGTGVQVDILVADTDSIIAGNAITDIDTAAISGIASVTGGVSSVIINYDAGDITDGDAGTSLAIYVLTREGFLSGQVSGTSIIANGFLLPQLPGGTDVSPGVATLPPSNKVEIRKYPDDTYIEDVGGQRVYGRITHDSTNFILSFYTNEAGVETVHSLTADTISVYYRSVYTIDNVPTFGADGGFLASADLTNDVVPATNSLAGKVTLTQIRTLAQPEVEYRTITGGEITAKGITLSGTPLTPAKVLVDAIGGVAQEYSVDYTVAGDFLDWDSLGLDGVLTAGDKLRVVYWV